MKEFLLEILGDPISADPLIYDPSENCLHAKNDGRVYKIFDKVPILLDQGTTIASTPLHQNVHMGFNYGDHYQKDAEVYDYFEDCENRATKNEIQRLHEAIVKSVPGTAQLILDIGCGNGWVARHFLKKNRKVVSMDISTINPLKALQNYPCENHAAIVADAFHLPFKNNSIDCIIASEIIEHVYDPKLFVEKIVEKLKAGGKLIITTPYNEKIEYYLCVHCNLPTPKNAHLHSFNKQNISNVIEANNVNWTARTFANKFLIRTRLNILFGFLPFALWKHFDATVDKILTSPTRFIIEIIKK
jgi:2-polyprenyl-3-methyl-5-hydroxy-6-metoxy-1,4-benzoquinol methylase